MIGIDPKIVIEDAKTALALGRPVDAAVLVEACGKALDEAADLEAELRKEIEEYEESPADPDVTDLEDALSHLRKVVSGAIQTLRQKRCSADARLRAADSLEKALEESVRIAEEGL